MKMMEKKVKILVVDDEAIVRESIRDWLEDAGYQVATAESGEEALALVKGDLTPRVIPLLKSLPPSI